MHASALPVTTLWFKSKVIEMNPAGFILQVFKGKASRRQIQRLQQTASLDWGCVQQSLAQLFRI